MRKALTSLALVLCSTALTQAQTTCDRELMFQMAQEVLDNRAELPGFSPRNTGGEAAYLLLRYGQIDASTAYDLLMEGRSYRQTDEILLAHEVSDPNGTLQGDPRDVLVDAYHHVERAFLLLDSGQTYFDLVALIQNDPERSEAFNNTWFGGGRLPSLISDQPPEVIEAIAARAEADGHIVAAGGLYALLPDDSYQSFWNRAKTSGHPLADIVSPQGVTNNGTYPLFHAQPIFDPGTPLSAEQRQFRLELFDILRATLAEAGPSTLSIATNQSGRTAELAEVSRQYLAAVERGQIDPTRRPEEGWTFILATMIDVLGPDATRNTLGGFDLWADDRHYAGRTLAVFEFATFAETARPWLRGETDQMPSKPATISDAFDWQSGIFVWGAMRDGATLPLFEKDDPFFEIAVEGYIQLGQFDAALDYATRVDGVRGRVKVAEDVMTRQNRLCDQMGILPGNSLMTGGKMVYDFQR